MQKVRKNGIASNAYDGKKYGEKELQYRSKADIKMSQQVFNMKFLFILEKKNIQKEKKHSNWNK